jgi:hypothetical protein
MLYVRGGREGGVGLALWYARGGRVSGVGLAMLYVCGCRVGGVGLAITSLRTAGSRYSFNIRGFCRNGVWEGLGI